MVDAQQHHVAIVGAGTIGLSFVALYLTNPLSSSVRISIYDPRPHLDDYVNSTLPSLLPAGTSTSNLTICSSLADAVRNATIIQESGPENLAFKIALWPQIETLAPPNALFWSSTSGIPASAQATDMKQPERLVVVHPFNPPHVMPLLEIVPSPVTMPSLIETTIAFWRGLGREPVVLKKECTGFVANRIAFALLREAASLVAQGVISVEDCDRLVTSSMGPRWSVAGPFKSYAAGGGERGLRGFFEKIGETVQGCWEASEESKFNLGKGESWEEVVCKQADGLTKMSAGERDAKTRRVLEAVKA